MALLTILRKATQWTGIHPSAAFDHIHGEPAFQHAATCERMRADRNGTPLSILVFTVPHGPKHDEYLGLLANALEARLRLTDTSGWLPGQRLGVLLPDTTESGAWKAASDICDTFPPGNQRPDCQVLRYPDPHLRAPDDELVGTGEPVGQSRTAAAKQSSEYFLISATPWWKRGLDIAGACAGLLLTLPVLFTAAVAIKLTSRGPVFFVQEREGIGGRRFRMFKLRTMAVGAEEGKQALRPFSEQDGPAFKMQDDPRTTRIGRLLRSTSLDELPQFWNVLIGDMSLVGPRPLPTEESLECRRWQRRRLAVVPGMTCLWQVNGRNTVAFDDWVRMDLQYIRRRSLLHDLSLLFRTPAAMIVRSAAD